MALKRIITDVWWPKLLGLLDLLPYQIVQVTLNKDPGLNPKFGAHEVETGYFVWNVVVGPYTHRDLLLFFGRERTGMGGIPYRIIHLEAASDWAVVLPLIIPPTSIFEPMFTSATQARKNGWKDKFIPLGWSELALNKKHIKIYLMRFA